MSNNEDNKIENGEQEIEKKIVENKENTETAEENEEKTDKVERVEVNEEKTDKAENAEVKAEKVVKKSINALKIFYKPVEAVRTAVRNNYWKSGLIFIAFYIFIAAISAGFQTVDIWLSKFDYQIEYYEEKVDEYQKEDTTYYKMLAEKYEERLKEAKIEKWSSLKDIELYLAMIKASAYMFIYVFARLGLYVLLLFAAGRILTKQGKLSQVVAGVGISVNVYYINLIVLPLIAKIPLLGSLSALSSIVSAFVLFLLYFVFKETFETDDEKSAIGAFAAVAVVTLILAFLGDGIEFVQEIIAKLKG